LFLLGREWLIIKILNAGNTSGGGKKGKHTDFGVLSCGVESEGFAESYFPPKIRDSFFT
jgi:hypothetical protein